MREILEPIFPVFVVLITLIALSGIVVIVLSVFKAWAKHFYHLGFQDGMKAQASHDKLCREENERPKGKWIEIKKDSCYRCSNCNEKPYFAFSIYNYKYCPYCGADMREEAENDKS